MAKSRNTLKSAQPQPEAVKQEPKKSKLKSIKLPQWNGVENQRAKLIIGLILLCFSSLMLIAFTSHLFTGNKDQSLIKATEPLEPEFIQYENWLGGFGAHLSQWFIADWFGIASFCFVLIVFLIAFKMLFSISLLNFKKVFQYSLFTILWLPTAMAFIFRADAALFIGGGIGYAVRNQLTFNLGEIGAFLVILFSGLGFFLLVTDFKLEGLFSKEEEEEEETKKTASIFDDIDGDEEEEMQLITAAQENLVTEAAHLAAEEQLEEIEDEATSEEEVTEEVEIPQPETTTFSVDFEDSNDVEDAVSNTEADEEIDFTSDLELETTVEEEVPAIEIDASLETELSIETPPQPEEDTEEELSIEVEKTEIFETELSDKKVNKMMEEIGEYDPTLDLGRFQGPPIELLNDYGKGAITVNKDELERNKNRIVDTLKNYKIEITKIKATIGPTVTLYEIVPAPGVRISKIKNLEDDIALSLSALGIRIIAPIPGRGTIGIEVPNENPDTVSMRSVIKSEKFQNSDMALPVALGKTISNETYVADLAKMPHLLMAGATGQGKSVGLNCILVSLLFKKHPSQIKFVLVDPKKVELTLFSKIERHYLAKLPDSEEAIITDTTKVIHTLNSLCIEMDQRYELLKNAMVRNLKEYNDKFVKRKLNPENGHRYLPYIVVVIDEFADLIMTAGKEVETPIARLAQLARAIGIHLIIATQRPSVNVITGMIKANFPTRISFRVTSKIDSRTILDQGGADQLIGRGDMLLNTGNDTIRIQCAFVDTPEVDEITEFIGNQQGYPEAFMLPEYVDENAESSMDLADMDRDALFEDAARVIVMHQQGSASLLQRKLKLGYNRAGRIVDQLEAAGIIGPFEGSKARQVLIPDDMALEQKLQELKS